VNAIPTVRDARAPGTHRNALLEQLDAEEAARLAPGLELVAPRLGDVLYEPGVQMHYAWFPANCIVSLHYVTASGASAESAGVGNDGMVGIALFLGGSTTSNSAVVRASGHAWRLRRNVLLEEFQRCGRLQRILLRYTNSLMAQIAQTVICNRHHSVEQRLCRCLLMTLDRLPPGPIVLTQDLIAGTLGVRREGITEAAGRLQQAGVIRYRRGHIIVQERAALEAMACECYAAVEKELQQQRTLERRQERPLAQTL
jgi:CRP-like cAMP-binding protein